MKSLIETMVILLAVVVLGATAAAQQKEAEDPLEKLRDGYAKYMAEIMAPLRSFLKEELEAYEKRMIKLGDLDLVVALRDARIKYTLESGTESNYAEFPIDVAAFAEKHGEGGKQAAELRKRYFEKLTAVWLPAQKKYVVALDALEAEFVKANAARKAEPVRVERQRIKLEMSRPGILAKVPEGVSQFGGNLYWRFEQKMTWPEAKKACEEVGGHLVTISSYEEDMLVKKLAKGKDCWLGFSDVAKEGVFVWVTGEPFEYQGWAPGEPNGGTSQNWGEYYHWGKGWDDRDGGEIRYICEWEVPKR